MRAKNDARLTEDRDAAIARLLEQMPAGTDAGGPGPCLEPEVLAAWMEGTLSAAERQIAEGHAAGCDRCQVMLAAMVRSEPAPVRRARWWSTGAIRWAAPLVAGALALTLWFAADPAILRSRATPPSAKVVRPPSESASTAANQTGAREAPRPADAPASPAAQDRAARSAGNAAELRTASKADERRADASAKAKTEAPAALDKKVEVSKPALEARKDAPSAGALAALPAPPVPAAPVPAAKAPVQSTPRPMAAPPAPAAAQAAASQPARDRFADALTPNELVPRDIVSPASAFRWRIVSADRVDRSIDAGATWTHADLPPGSKVTAGSSPAAGICWLVGRDGLVLKTVDGISWTRIPFPEPLALGVVLASSADAAVVTSDSGRSFATSDGGRTWARR